ncbi:hypothetical protein FO519_009056 [Halicephalobus sp. NKZ332]|nr:hypothetical protein FO519_009056 [Halicephalobus sp. NKZ332]
MNFCFSSSISIDNDIIGEPDIECLDQEIRVWIKTRKVFAGRIYAKGKADDPDCAKDDFAQQKTKKPHFDLNLGMCGMKSLRSFDPRGMYYGITLVVSFHPMFITKVDQAFHVKCFFEEANRGLTAELGVSMLPTTEVEARHGIPGCTYSIHRSSIDDLDAGRPAGAPIQFAKVGDKVLHQWHCDDQMFGVLINNCYVTDGVDKKADVIDSRGCPVDPILITGIRYSEDMQRAYAESQVFKFADRPGVWFFCQIQMCMKKEGMCDGITPPACAGSPVSVTKGGFGGDLTEDGNEDSDGDFGGIVDLLTKKSRIMVSHSKNKSNKKFRLPGYGLPTNPDYDLHAKEPVTVFGPAIAPGIDKIDTMHVTWESQRMARDLPISTDSTKFLTEDPNGPPMIAGQLLIYDLDETPPGAVEEEISKQQELYKQDCAISRQGLMVMAMSLGSLAFILFIVILALFLKLKRKNKDDEIPDFYPEQQPSDSVEDRTLTRKEEACSRSCKEKCGREGYCEPLSDNPYYYEDSSCCSVGYKWICACEAKPRKSSSILDDLLNLGRILGKPALIEGLNIACWGYCKNKGFDKGRCVSTPGVKDSWCLDGYACRCLRN